MLIDWRAERERVGLSQTEVAKRMTQAGFDWIPLTCSKVERGLRSVGFYEGLFLCELFDIRVDSRRDLHVII